MRTHRPLAESLERRQLLAVDIGVTFDLKSSYQPGESIDGSDFHIDYYEDPISAGEFTYRVILATDTAGTEDVVAVASGDVPALQVGVGGTLDFHYVVPESLRDQSRFLIVTLESDTPDIDPSDNRVVATLRVGTPPDEEPTDPEPEPEPTEPYVDLGFYGAWESHYRAGETIDGESLFLTNYGDAITAGQFTYRVIIASDEAGTKDVITVASGDVPAVEAYDYGQIEFSYVLPESLVGKTLFLIATLGGDTPDAVSTNNRVSGSLVVVSKTLHDVGVDFYLGYFYMPGDVIDGEGFEVYNKEAALAAGEYTYRVILASDAAGTKDVVVIAAGDLPEMYADGDSATLDFRYVIPASLAGKARHLIVTIDGEADSVPDDNRASDVLRVAGALASETIIGTDGADTFSLYAYGNDDDRFILARSGSVPEGESGIAFGRFADVTSLTFDFGGGGDSLYVRDVPFPVRASGGAGNDHLSGGDRDDTLEGGDGDDALDGGLGRDLVRGGAGRDKLFGGDEADTLDGGGDDDILDGSGGDDRLDGGDGNDLMYGDGSDSRPGRDTLIGGNGRDRMFGGAGDDRLSGGAGGDLLFGGSGDDVLLGQGGRDHLRGQEGNDLLIGGAGNDLLHSLDAGGHDTLSGGTGRDAANADASDLLASIELRPA